MLKKIIKKITPPSTRDFIKQSITFIKSRVRGIIWPFQDRCYHLLRVFYSPKIPKHENGKVLIHLGCGAQNNKDFINVDITPFPHVHHAQDIKDLSIFPDNFADLIYASHVVEHIGHTRLEKTFKEWNRVLKKGGVLRISVPDFDKLIEIYKKTGNNIESFLYPLVGDPEHIPNIHLSIFNKEYLSSLFKRTGFDSVKNWDSTNDNYGFTDFATTFKASLNMEGSKK